MRGLAKGLSTLRALLNGWLDWIALPELLAGCPILGAGFELEAREGSLRDYLVKLQTELGDKIATMLQDAVDAGELKRTTDIGQLLFELRGVSLAFHQDLRVMRSPSAREHAERAVSAVLDRHSLAKPDSVTKRTRSPTAAHGRSGRSG
jgi:hypothetical protein